MSLVEQTLRYDPGGVYGRMDFNTRDRYRHIIEKIAKNSLLSEVEVARKAIDLRSKVQPGRATMTERHMSDITLLIKDCHNLSDCQEYFFFFQTLRKMIGRFPVFLSTAHLSYDNDLCRGLAGKSICRRINGWHLGLWFSPAFMRKSSAVALVNWLVTLIVNPDPLPRMDFSDGIPPESRSLVVVPTMIIALKILKI